MPSKKLHSMILREAIIYLKHKNEYYARDDVILNHTLNDIREWAKAIVKENENHKKECMRQQKKEKHYFDGCEACFRNDEINNFLKEKILEVK